MDIRVIGISVGLSLLGNAIFAWISGLSGYPTAAPYLIALPLTTILLYFVLAGWIGPFFRRWRDNALIRKHPEFQLAEEQQRRVYRSLLEPRLNTSSTLYFRLVSAHTMFQVGSAEEFIWTRFHRMAQAQLNSKDVRFLLLRRNSRPFAERARQFFSFPDYNRRRNDAPQELAAYRSDCEGIAANIENLLGAGHVKYYGEVPHYRLIITDDLIFASRYEPRLSSALSTISTIVKSRRPKFYDDFREGFLDDFAKAEFNGG